MKTTTSAYVASFCATLTVALMAATVSTGTAHAATAPQTREVRFADLDLTTAKGRHELDRRIVRAARDVCGMDDMTTGSRLPSREASECYRLALRNTHEQVALAIGSGAHGG